MGKILVFSRSLAGDWGAWTLQSSAALGAAALVTCYVRRHALEDVGLTRAHVAREVDKPLWR